jgi:phenylacetic acid degradation operon negative regulatory protein
MTDWGPWRPGGGGASARSLLLTVLGEFVLPSGGRAWTSTLVQAMGALDVEANAARQAVSRSAAAGLLIAERFGRRTRWTLSKGAADLLTEGTERIHHFSSPAEGWDGTWLVLLTSVPEGDRRLRYRLRVRLGWQGFAPLAPGVWLSPWADRQQAAAAVLQELGLATGSLSLVAEPGAVGSLAERAAVAWDVAGIEADYEAFITATEAKAPASPLDSFVALASLVHDWRHFPGADPGLPEPLLPQPWSGKAAAELFADRHWAWNAQAWQWWAEHAADQ